jgi:hypothetical protein
MSSQDFSVSQEIEEAESLLEDSSREVQVFLDNSAKQLEALKTSHRNDKMALQTAFEQKQAEHRREYQASVDKRDQAYLESLREHKARKELILSHIQPNTQHGGSNNQQTEPPIAAATKNPSFYAGAGGDSNLPEAQPEVRHSQRLSSGSATMVADDFKSMVYVLPISKLLYYEQLSYMSINSHPIDIHHIDISNSHLLLRILILQTHCVLPICRILPSPCVLLMSYVLPTRRQPMDVSSQASQYGSLICRLHGPETDNE